MKRFCILMYFVTILGGTFYAQIPNRPQSLTSPNVANLGLYGEIPVSNFTGIPDISIPLYDIEVGDFKIPLSLSYHAAGIRPDQHPGWTGLGWNLNTGGVISRKVNNMPDDWHKDKFVGFTSIGYYFHPGILNVPDWNTTNGLEEIAENVGNVDLEPDEFNFDFLDYHGKFMLNSDKTWVVQCDKPVKVDFSGTRIDVPFDKSYTAFENVGYSPAFEGFTLTTEDGIRYVFGKDKNAIEYSIGFFRQATEWWTATAWHLTKIILTNGQEITYSYERGDFINQMCISLYDDLGSYSFNEGILDPECSSSSHSTIGASYDGNLISPVYLSRISFPEGEAVFYRSENWELRYDRDIYDFKYMMWERNPQFRFVRFLADNGLNDNYPYCMNKLKWYKITNLEVKDKKGKSIKNYYFSYHINPYQRLMLKSINEYEGRVNGKCYSMQYESPELLPDYLSGKVDHWGFFNDHMMTDNYLTHYNSREPNPAVSTYGILSKLYYPTGGYTRFVFEPHEYHKQVKKVRGEGYEETTSQKNAGGLRIKKILNSATGEESDEMVEKEFFYVDDYLVNKEKSKSSSGVLGGQFKYYFDDYVVHGIGSDRKLKKMLKRFSSQSVLPACINSSGCHIGYSEVIEKKPDGSFIRYKYTNFDNGHIDESSDAILNHTRTPYEPYNSKSMERGRLMSEENYSADGVMKSSRKMNYECSSNNYVRSVKSSLQRLCPGSAISYAEGCAYKVFMYNYRTKSIEETNSDNPLAPVSVKTVYEYDQDGLIKEISTNTNGGIRKVAYKRPRNYTSDIFKKMVKGHVLSPIVEEKESFIPVDGSERQLKQMKYGYMSLGDNLFPCFAAQEKIGEGPLKDVYHCLDFDNLGHPVEVTRNGDKTVYLWSYNNSHLAAVIKGVSHEEIERAIGNTLPFQNSENPDFSKLLRLRIYLPQAQITTYTHQPMVGVTSITDPRGVTTSYEYDLFKRLIKQKDCNGKVEKAYDYRYAIDLNQKNK